YNLGIEKTACAKNSVHFRLCTAKKSIKIRALKNRTRIPLKKGFSSISIDTHQLLSAHRLYAVASQGSENTAGKVVHYINGDLRFVLHLWHKLLQMCL